MSTPWGPGTPRGQTRVARGGLRRRGGGGGRWRGAEAWRQGRRPGAEGKGREEPSERQGSGASRLGPENQGTKGDRGREPVLGPQRGAVMPGPGPARGAHSHEDARAQRGGTVREARRSPGTRRRVGHSPVPGCQVISNYISHGIW